MTTDGAHSCGPTCTQPLCVANRHIAELAGKVLYEQKMKAEYLAMLEKRDEIAAKRCALVVEMAQRIAELEAEVAEVAEKDKRIAELEAKLKQRDFQDEVLEETGSLLDKALERIAELEAEVNAEIFNQYGDPNQLPYPQPPKKECFINCTFIDSQQIGVPPKGDDHE